MRLESVVRMVLDGIPLLLIAGVFVLSLFAVGYLLIYRVIMKGKKRLRLSKVLWILAIISYLMVLFFVTLLRPSAGEWYGRKIYPLFYSYQSAWETFNVMEWRNIILNIAMFVPFGFLLPMTFCFFRKFWRTYLAGFLVTFAIESTQLIFGLGVVECDDIFDNFLGVMIGYGVYAIAELIGDFIRKRKCAVVKTLAFQIPLLGTLLLFCVIFTAYNAKELGNLRADYTILETDFDAGTAAAAQTYGTETKTAMIYRADVLNRDRADKMAEEYFEMLGTSLDETRKKDYYDETAVYYSKDSRMLWIDYIGAVYGYTDFNVGFGNEEVSVEKNAKEEEIRAVLSRYGVTIPDDAEFDSNGGGVYCFSVAMSTDGKCIQDGALRCTYYQNGVMGNINNGIIFGIPYKEFELISEQEASEKIYNGKVSLRNVDISSVILGSVSLSYRMDTKGFYQPVYLFDASAGDCRIQIDIPAVK